MGIKQEIAQLVDKLPNEALEAVLVYLREVEKTTVERQPLSINLDKILTEDRDLLQRLAK